MLHDDLDVINFTIRPKEKIPHINVYGLGDWHIGSAQTDFNKLKKVVEYIFNDEYGYIVICGDMMDVATKSSVSNVYEATMTINQQRDKLIELLTPLKDRIMCVVPGNHEDRISKEVSLNLMYDVCLLLGIEDVYRENLGLIKVSFGDKGSNKPNVYGGVVTHGSSIHKHRKFIMQVEGADFAFSGHTHNNHEMTHAKLRLDIHAGVARVVPFEEIVLSSAMDKVGGYGTKKEFPLPPPYKLQYLELKAIPTKERNKSINYHSIQI